MTSILSEARLVFSPRTLLSREDFFRAAVRGSLVYVIPLTLLVFTAAALNSARIEQVLASTGASMQFQKYAPWNRLFFPVFAALWILAASLLRQLWCSVIGDASSFARMTAVTLLGLVPLFAVLLASSLAGTIFPSGGAASGRVFLYTTLFLILAACCYDAFVCTTAFRESFGMNRGRAVLTWLAGYAGPMLFCCGGGLLLTI